MDADRVALPANLGLSRRRYDRLVAESPEPGRLRDGTSVVLLRDAPGGLEVFLLHRVSQMAFAGGMTVFPGGGVDERDRSPGDLPSEDTDRPELRRSAVRELFEETGVLLAGPSRATVLDDTSPLADARAALSAGETDLTAVLDAAGLVLRDDLLTPWARWVTPVLMPTRYDVRFWIAVVPPGQEPDGATTEAAEAEWSTPTDAITAWADERRSLMPPTWVVLTELAGHPDVASVLSAAARRRIEPITPEPSPDGDRVVLTVPRQAHPVTAGASSDPTHVSAAQEER